MLSCQTDKPVKNESPAVVTESKKDTVFIAQAIDSTINKEYYIMERLPLWVVESEVLQDLKINKLYKVENRLNPLYLEDDFNGDSILDVALPIIELSSNKKGFAIIHGKTFEVFIIGAGTTIKNALGDNQDYIDIWRINRIKKNEPGVDETEPLMLENHSIEIEKSEVGGGQIFWNGKEYEYFHQTC